MTDWKIVRLNEIAESVDYGVTASAIDHPIGPKFLRITDIQNGTVDWDSVPWCECDICSTVDQRLNPGDIVFARTGATTGKSFLIQECPKDAIFASYLIRVRVGALAEPRYISHFFQTPNYWAQITKSARGVAQPGVNATILKELKIPLPTLEEQKRIADVLDRAEALRAKRRDALVQLDELTQSIFIDMFGDVVKNEKSWPTEQMGNIMQIRRGASPRPIEKYLGGEINWIKIGDGTKGSDIYIESCSDKIIPEGLKKTVFLKAGSLIFANCGVSLGFARILKVDGCIHDGWLSLEEIPEDKLDKLFLLKALNSITEHFRRIAPSGTQPNLNTGLMKNFRIILPPLSLQKEFSHRIATLEKLKTTHKASLEELNELFSSLQHRAFRGELGITPKTNEQILEGVKI